MCSSCTSCDHSLAQLLELLVDRAAVQAVQRLSSRVVYARMMFLQALHRPAMRQSAAADTHSHKLTHPLLMRRQHSILCVMMSSSMLWATLQRMLKLQQSWSSSSWKKRCSGVACNIASHKLTHARMPQEDDATGNNITCSRGLVHGHCSSGVKPIVATSFKM